MFGACIVIFVSFGLIQTVSLNYKDPFATNYDYVDFKNMVRPTRNLMLKPGAESLFLKSLGSNSNVDDASVYGETNDVIRLPTTSGNLVVVDSLPQSTYFDDGIRESLPLDYDDFTKNMQTPIAWNTKYLQTPYVQDIYEGDQAFNSGSVNVESEPYEVDLYPFVHTSISAALNPISSMHSIPPSYVTEIHEAVPSLEKQADYDIDVMNPENSELMPPNLRFSRSRGEEDFLEQLEHEAMMNNILPTMPVPFVRGAEGLFSQTSNPKTNRPVMAFYQTRRSLDCDLPILLGCSSNLMRGMMSGMYPEHVQPLTPASAGYRDVEQMNEK